jgi:hypothetical protein
MDVELERKRINIGLDDHTVISFFHKMGGEAVCGWSTQRWEGEFDLKLLRALRDWLVANVRD